MFCVCERELSYTVIRHEIFGTEMQLTLYIIAIKAISDGLDCHVAIYGSIAKI
jgi:hypothetical protein